MVTLLSQYTDFDSEKVKNIALYVHFIEVFIELKDVNFIYEKYHITTKNRKQLTGFLKQKNS
jgi:hypothetical protein